MPDREKLIELLDEATEKLKELCGGLNDHHGNCVRADHLIANGVTVQQWIPVTERLPENYSDVLAFSLNGHIAKLLYTEGGVFKQAGLRVFVTHWMPLPQPPKGLSNG